MAKGRRRYKDSLPAIFIFWSILVYAKYLENHPLRPVNRLNQLSRLKITDLRITFPGIVYVLSHLFALFLFMYVVYLLGNRIFRALRLKNLSARELFIFSMGLGLGCSMAYSFTLGLLGLYYSPAVYACGLAVVLLSLKDIRIHCVFLSDLFCTWKPRLKKCLSSVKRNPFPAALIILIVMQCIVSFMFSLTPGMDWDSLNYHLNVPNRYMQAHKMYPIKFLIPSYMPHNIDLLYVLGMLSKDFVLSKNINFALGLLLVLYVYIFSKRFFPSGLTPLFAAYILLFTPDFIHVLGLSYIDFGMSFFFLLSLDSIIRWHECDDKKWLVVGGLFSGLALGAKYTAIMGVTPLSISLFVLSLRKKGMRVTALNLIYFGTAIVGAMGPWLVRNLILLGNPVYPLLYNIFGGADFTVNLDTRWNEYCVAKFGMGRSFTDYLLLPWNVTVNGNMDFRHFGSVAPLIWPIFVPLIFFLNNVRKIILFMLGIFIFVFVFWAVKMQFARYLFFTYPLLAIITAYSAGELFTGQPDSTGKKVMRLARFLVMILFLYSGLSVLFPYTVTVVAKYFPVVLGNESRKDFADRVVINNALFEYIDRELPSDAKILFLWENRTYYCKRDIVADWHFLISSVFELVFPANASVEEIREILQKDYGITHIFENSNLRKWAYFQEGGPFFSNADQKAKFLKSQELYEEFKAKYCEKLTRKDGVDLFRIDYSRK